MQVGLNIRRLGLRAAAAALRAWERARSLLSGVRRQRGFILVEAVVAIGIVGTATLATLGFISTATTAGALNSRQTTAAWLATSQAEYISHAAYVATPGQYEAISAPGDFTVANTTAPYPDGNDAIQIVTITVSYQGSEVLTTEIVKVDR
jgi:type II secretory pathway pseudopilin PulG